MASAADEEKQLPSCQNDRRVEELISSVKFVGYNINTDNEMFFKTNPLLGSIKNMQDVKILFTGLLNNRFQKKGLMVISLFASYAFCF